MGAVLQVEARAKVNLSLDILGVRDDGYHEVEMVLQTISLHDTLFFAPAPPGEVILNCSDPELPTNEENLVLRAAALLREEAARRRGLEPARLTTAGVHIFLEKRIPVGAGLGGGSADAAAALRGLNDIWSLNLAEEELMALARRLGSDVPFCLQGGTSLARGTGTSLTPLPSPPSGWLLLAKPPFGVLTAWAYRAYDAWQAVQLANGRESRGGKMGKMEENTGRYTPRVVAALRSGDGDWGRLATALGNALEEPVNAHYPLLGRLKASLLAAGALGALMTGSGSCVYGVFPTEAAALAARERLATEFQEEGPFFFALSHTC